MPLDYKLFYQRNLPHYQPIGATLFITFRLAGSLPRILLTQIEEEFRRKETEIIKVADLSKRLEFVYSFQKEIFARWDSELDTSQLGPQWLAKPEVANLICDALHFRDGKVFTLEAYSVMPNHVHLVCTPLMIDEKVVPLSKMLLSLKSYTARQANLILGRNGDFWQHESYDHVVRDDLEFNRIVNYVLQNRIRAGLPNQWVYCKAS